MVDATAPARRVKPRLRGVSHQIAAYVALIAGGALVAAAPGARAAIAAALYAGSLVTLFGISALYHRPMWSHAARRRLRRLDHGAIFILIAGSATPFCMLALPPERGNTFLLIVWGGAAAGIAKAVFWPNSPRALLPALCVGLGLTILPYLGDFHAAAGTTGIALIAVGGAIYIVGAVVYATRRPDPIPAVFGYHEVFHAMVVGASVCHFIAVVPVILAPAR